MGLFRQLEELLGQYEGLLWQSEGLLKQYVGLLWLFERLLRQFDGQLETFQGMMGHPEGLWGQCAGLKRVERSTGRNLPPIFTKLATKVESQEIWLPVVFGGNPKYRQTGSGINF